MLLKLSGGAPKRVFTGFGELAKAVADGSAFRAAAKRLNTADHVVSPSVRTIAHGPEIGAGRPRIVGGIGKNPLPELPVWAQRALAGTAVGTGAAATAVGVHQLSKLHDQAAGPRPLPRAADPNAWQQTSAAAKDGVPVMVSGKAVSRALPKAAPDAWQHTAPELSNDVRAPAPKMTVPALIAGKAVTPAAPAAKAGAPTAPTPPKPPLTAEPSLMARVGDHLGKYWPGYALGGTGLLAASALLSNNDDDEDEPQYSLKYSRAKLAGGPAPVTPPAPWAARNVNGGASWGPKLDVSPHAPAPQIKPQVAPAQASAARMQQNSMLRRGVTPAPDPRVINATAEPATNAFTKGLNGFTNLSTKGLLGAGHYALNRAGQAITGPMTAASSAVFGQNHPNTAFSRTLYEQMGQNAQAATTDMRNALSTSQVPSAMFSHAQQQYNSAQQLPRIPGAMDKVESAMGAGVNAMGAPFSLAGHTLGMLPGGDKPGTWAAGLRDIGHRIGAGDPSMLQIPAEAAALMVPGPALVNAGGKVLQTAGTAAKIPAIARAGELVSKAAPMASKLNPWDAAMDAGARIGRGIGIGETAGRIGALTGMNTANDLLETPPTHLSPEVQKQIQDITGNHVYTAEDFNPAVTGVVNGMKGKTVATTGGGTLAAPKGNAVEQASMTSATNMAKMTPEEFGQFKQQTASMRQAFGQMPPEQQAKMAPELMKRHVQQYMKEAGVTQGALSEKVLQGKWTPDDLPRVAETLWQDSNGKWKMPSMQDAFQFLTSEQVPWWQKAAAVVGLGVGTIGIIRALTGNSDGILLTLLGLGTAAGGTGMFNDQINSALNYFFPQEQPQAPPTAAEAGSMPAKPITTGLAGLDTALQDGTLTDQEVASLRDPKMMAQFNSATPEQIPGVIQNLRRNPAIDKRMNDSLAQYGWGKMMYSPEELDRRAVAKLQKDMGLTPDAAARYWAHIKTLPRG